MIDIFDDPLFTPFLPYFAGEPLDKRRAINQLSEMFSTLPPLMEKISNASTYELRKLYEKITPTVTEHTSSSLGRRYQDATGKLYHVDSLAYHTNRGKDAQMHVHVDSIGPDGRIHENPTGEHGFMKHSAIKNNVESSRWNYHSASKGFEPGGKYEQSGYTDSGEE